MEMSRRMAESVGFLSCASRHRCRFTRYCMGQPTAYCPMLEGAVEGCSCTCSVHHCFACPLQPDMPDDKLPQCAAAKMGGIGSYTQRNAQF